MPMGFDLTDIRTVPRPAPARQPQPQPQPQAQPEQPVTRNHAQEMTMEQALTSPIQAELTNEDGSNYQDNLKRKAPGLARELWQIDKFASKPIPVQRKVKDPDTGVERLIWIDQTGNNILDPDTGSVQLKPKA